MLKKIFLIIIISILICGCTKDNKLYLDSKYYNEGKYIEVTSEEVNNKKGEVYLLFTYNDFCAFSVPCDATFESVMKKHNISILSIPIDEYKNTYLFDTVRYAPSVILVNRGKVVAYLDANEDEDISKYTDTNEFEKWLDEYIYFNKR